MIGGDGLFIRADGYEFLKQFVAYVSLYEAQFALVSHSASYKQAHPDNGRYIVGKTLKEAARLAEPTGFQPYFGVFYTFVYYRRLRIEYLYAVIRADKEHPAALFELPGKGLRVDDIDIRIYLRVHDIQYNGMTIRAFKPVAANSVSERRTAIRTFHIHKSHITFSAFRYHYFIGIFPICQVKYRIYFYNQNMYNDLSKIVGENLRAARKAKGVTQKQIAAELHKYQSDYSDYETGKVQLDYEKIVYLCKRFDITPNDLFGIM